MTGISYYSLCMKSETVSYQANRRLFSSEQACAVLKIPTITNTSWWCKHTHTPSVLIYKNLTDLSSLQSTCWAKFSQNKNPLLCITTLSCLVHQQVMVGAGGGAEHQEEASQTHGASVEGHWVEEEASLEFPRVVEGAWRQWVVEDQGRSSEEAGAWWWEELPVRPAEAEASPFWNGTEGKTREKNKKGGGYLSED